MSNDAEKTEKRQKSIQIVFRMPESFMRRFDRTSEQLGYTRSEAIREAMRRFQEEGEQKLMQRPETAAEAIKQMMSSVMTPLIELSQRTREAEEFGKSKKIMTLPDGDTNR